MKILAIETSCDETAISLLTSNTSQEETTFTLLGNLIHTQIDIHREFGGVFPALAKREHQKNIVPLLLRILGVSSPQPASSTPSPEQLQGLQKILEKEPLLYEHIVTYILPLPRPSIDALCVTYGPGLEPALWVGINAAQALGFIWNIPVIPVNHMEGHLVSVLVPHNFPTVIDPSIPGTLTPSFTIPSQPFEFPALGLLISGGHTELITLENIGSYRLIGKTRDDAIGEAYDKVARMIDIPYPGGPEIARRAHDYRTQKNISESYLTDFYHLIREQASLTPKPGEVFPRPMIHSGDYDFSFSGLKTAVRAFQELLTKKYPEGIPLEIISLLCYEFEQAATEVIVRKTLRAFEEVGAQTIIVGGGVAANTFIRESLTRALHEQGYSTPPLFPQSGLTGDNAFMIALAGYFKWSRNPEQKYETIRAQGNITLSDSL